MCMCVCIKEECKNYKDKERLVEGGRGGGGGGWRVCTDMPNILSVGTGFGV